MLKDYPATLHDNVIAVQEIMHKNKLLTLSVEEREQIEQGARQLLEKLESAVQNSLTVGFIGGTGVGKSTLMNTLAGSEIASVSHRRPHTDAVLIYRYEKTPFPVSLPLTGVPWTEFTHNAESIDNILLCDLPDFDSVQGEHRERVLLFLEHLDILVWVTSLEKYADQMFYNLIDWVKKSHRNFYFVLNKTDLLFEGRSAEDGLQELQNVANRFQAHLKEKGLSNPIIFMLSARGGLEKADMPYWNQLALFQQEIFRQRGLKEIKEIKAANIDRELSFLLKPFEQEEQNLLRASEVLRTNIVQLENTQDPWKEAFTESLKWKTEKFISAHILKNFADNSGTIGPTSFIAMIAKQWRNIGREFKDRENKTKPVLGAEIITELQQRLNNTEDRVVNSMLRAKFSPSFVDAVRLSIDIEAEKSLLEEKLNLLYETFPQSYQRPSFIFFKVSQYCVYFILAVLLIVALAGEDAWTMFISNPDWGNLTNFLITPLFSLFSPKGLAALGSYGLINLAAAYRFYRRYRKLLHKHMENGIIVLQEKTVLLWEEALQRVILTMKTLDKQVEDLIQALSALKRNDKY